VATLYRPKIVEYRLRDGAYRTRDGKRVTKDTPGAVRSETKSKTWHGRYTDGAGVEHQVKLSPNKEIARRMLAKLAGDAQLAGVGIADRYAEHRARPPAEHLEDYLRGLAAKGDTAEHVNRTGARVRAILDGCHFDSLDQLEASAVLEFIAGLGGAEREPLPLDWDAEWFTRAEVAAALGCHAQSVRRMIARDGLEAKGRGKARRYSRAAVQALQERFCRGAGVTTRNHYLTAVKGFTRWLARERRIPADPLSHLSRQNAEADVRHPRPALAEDLFGRFVEATASGTSFRGLAGPDRLVLYTLAANTGFRAGELASLAPASFALDGPRPTVTAAAAYSKRRRKDVQPLRADVAEMMRQYVAGKPRRQPLWPGAWKEAAAEMVRHDLAAAGIPYADEEGRYFDFHALRGQFISMLAAQGVHPKVAQVLARHSTVTLTMDYYTHLDVLDVRGALDQLPELPGTQGRQPTGESKTAEVGARRVQGASDGKRKAMI
jgi:integrase